MEIKIIEILKNEGLIFDEIVRKLGLESLQTGTLLLMMEIKGIIKNSGGKYLLSL